MKPPRKFLLATVVGPILLVLSACGTNPVTGKREIQFVSTNQEISIGRENYAPMKQSEGGDYAVLPDLSAYINEVGRRLVANDDAILKEKRDLPFEFTVLNNSVPNAWALPGGKIAVNRGLLTALDNEAELAAVLGHEITHALARHGAQAQERGTLLQGGLVAAQIGAAMSGMDERATGLLLGGASVGAQMVNMKFGRGDELQADEYGTRLMKAAGYDPQGAVTLQQTFVRLFDNKDQNWLDGLFASHPPSVERVKRNQELVAEIGAGGDLGRERFQARMKPLLDIKPAYDKYDAALSALEKKDTARAKSLAAEAARLEPREAQFQQLLGDIAVSEKRDQEALAYFQKAQQLNPGYFGSWLGGGVAQYRLNNRTVARQWLQRSYDLLPTAPAALYLGHISRDAGNTEAALGFYQAAASSGNSYGRDAQREAVLIDLPRRPGNYVATTAVRDLSGKLLLRVQNRAPVPVAGITVTPVLVNAAGKVTSSGRTVNVRGTLEPGEQVTVDAGLGVLTAEQEKALKFSVESARVVE
jgi:predicted Zn-dependent protease